MTIEIKAIASALPEALISNQDIIDRYALKMKADWIERNLGIKTRHWANWDTDKPITASDLGAQAVQNLNLKTFEGPIWVSTISPDFISPSMGSLIKRKLGLKDFYPAFDINAACSGLLYALAAAQSWLLTHSDCDEALVIATELRSRALNKQDRRTVFLFGDGAVALLLKKNSKEHSEHTGIQWIDLFSPPSESNEIYVPLYNEPSTITMQDGKKISSLATEQLAEKIALTLKQHGEKIENFDWVFSHQANQSINQRLNELLKINPKQSFSNLERIGNCSSAGIGISLDEASRTQRIKPGQKLLLLTMGAGYHYGAASLIWNGADWNGDL